MWEVLIEAGAEVATLNDQGETPLHIACLRGMIFSLLFGLLISVQGNINAVRVLLGRGVDVNARTKHGDTPLHYASRKGFSQIIELLVSHEADMNITSEFGSLEQVAKEFNKVTFTLFWLLNNCLIVSG